MYYIMYLYYMYLIMLYLKQVFIIMYNSLIFIRFL